MATTKRDPGAVRVETRPERIVVFKGDQKVFTVHPRAFQQSLKDQAILEATKFATDLARGLVATTKKAQ